MKNATGKKVVVVESPTKAKTIRKFLGKDFIVESCMGHVRDLPQKARDIPKAIKKKPWANLGVNVDDDFEPLYLVPKDKQKIVTRLQDILKSAKELILATDEDREGESISWHLLEVLKPQIPFKRMVFHEITKEAINDALTRFRDVDMNLVRAQEARRILDRLVGYTISPLLWKKVAYGLSAGRVQSVAVRLISERELERRRFVRAEYWNLVSDLEQKGESFKAELVEVKDRRLPSGKDFDALTGQLKDKSFLLLNEADAEKLKNSLKTSSWKVDSLTEKPIRRKPFAPFITSTLQQEGSRKLGLSARETMRVAQGLYEKGHITYMRTDSTQLSNQALAAAKKCILDLYGKEYLSPEPRDYSGKKTKGAQEAHEAIRPAGTVFVLPEEAGLSGLELALYDLIWKRTMASQMSDAVQKQVTAKIRAGDCLFSASGMTIEFPGFLRAYVEGSDDAEKELENKEVHLPPMKEGDTLKCSHIDPVSHETKPPARYTEASLIQKMEAEGIGRPSTYAAIMSTIVDRGYVRKQATSLVPTITALVVTKLLEKYFPEYVDLGFTTEMERSLDTIAEGDMDQIKYLKGIYLGKEGLRSQVEKQEEKIDPQEARSLKLEGLKDYEFRVGRYGAYVCRQEGKEEICATLPDQYMPADFSAAFINELIERKIKGQDALGKDPTTGLKIYLLSGRFGPYIQLGENEDGAGSTKPKRVGVPPNVKIDEIDLNKALEILSLPRMLGLHPDSKKEIRAGLGRFGPYVVHDGDFRSIPKTDDIFKVDLAKALELLNRPKQGRGRAKPVKELGNHPDGQPLAVYVGKYGPYIKWGKKNTSLPENLTPETVTLEKALELLGVNSDSAQEEPKKPGKKVKRRKRA